MIWKRSPVSASCKLEISVAISQLWTVNSIYYQGYYIHHPPKAAFCTFIGIFCILITPALFDVWIIFWLHVICVSICACLRANIIVYTCVNEIEPSLFCYVAIMSMWMRAFKFYWVNEIFLYMFCYYTVSMCACMRACKWYCINKIVIYLFCYYSVCEYVCVHVCVQRLWCVKRNRNITVFVASSYCKINVIFFHCVRFVHTETETVLFA